MQALTAQRIKIVIGFLFALAALPLAGCGDRNQAGTGQAGTSGGSSAMTPSQFQQNAQKQNEYLKNHPPTANAAPATH